jgi:type I restriction enzyme S subunit
MSWPAFPLQELTEHERPITYGVVKPGPEDDQGVLFVRGGDISDGKINIQQLRTITSEVSKPYARTILRGGELLISLVGNPGEVAIVPPELAGANIARQAGLIALRPEFNSKFIMYFLRSPKGRAELFQKTQGAVQQVINLSDLKTVKIALPDENTQQRIAGILSAYDDLIENNRRRIGLLEQAARLLYREWFVHFRFPGHETAKFVDGLPEGWTVTTFDAVCDTVGGGTPSTKNPEFWEDGDVTWVTPTDITRNDCLALLRSEKKITAAGLKHSSAKMVPPNTILMTSRASVGFFGLADFPVSTNQGFINIVPHDETMRYYLLFNLLHRVDEIRGHASGATYAEISKGKFRALPVVVPSERTVARFHLDIEKIINQVRTIKTQNAQLTRARDLLLPRLMDGRIPV